MELFNQRVYTLQDDRTSDKMVIELKEAQLLSKKDPPHWQEYEDSEGSGNAEGSNGSVLCRMRSSMYN
ncbi:hypothetical protein ABBQ38_000670 [Trebouxia sp. C0009 RCD-2024]